MVGRVANSKERIGEIVGVSISHKRGTPKENIKRAFLKKGVGIEGDSHSGDWHRMLSLLPYEIIEYVNAKGYDFKPGGFAENLTIKGLNFDELKIGDTLKLGDTAMIKITQKGKEHEDDKFIQALIGESILPHHGYFAEVIEEGEIKIGDKVEIC
jgi:MOSC domain-containing protein YiiM